MPLPYKKANRTSLDSLVWCQCHTHTYCHVFSSQIPFFFEFNGAELSAECAPPLTLYKVTF